MLNGVYCVAHRAVHFLLNGYHFVIPRMMSIDITQDLGGLVPPGARWRVVARRASIFSDHIMVNYNAPSCWDRDILKAIMVIIGRCSAQWLAIRAPLALGF